MSKKNLPPSSIDYQEWFIAKLHNNPELCELYLADSLKEKDPDIFLIALENVLEARTKNLVSAKTISQKDAQVLQKLNKLLKRAGFSLAFQEISVTSDKKEAKPIRTIKKSNPKIKLSPVRQIKENYGEQIRPAARTSAKKRTDR